MDVHKVTPIDAGVAARLEEFVLLRRDLHRHPELAFNEKRTSALVAERLTACGYEVSEGFGGTAVVGVLRKGNGSKRLALRADMDALPIGEQTGVDYSSQNAGVMHACGHDGHTAILLSAAKAVSERDFSGTLILIFQPAEEIGAGARRLISEGLFDRFPVDAIFGLHNWPGEPLRAILVSCLGRPWPRSTGQSCELLGAVVMVHRHMRQLTLWSRPATSCWPCKPSYLAISTRARRPS